MKDILLSIRPKWCEKILSGEKRIEVRKSKPSEVPFIPNQKAINFNIAMALLNNQETAWGKYIVNPNALRGQVITNEPGQVLVDYTGTGQGIRKMTEQAIQSQPLQLIDTITQLTRVVTGSTEVMTGETLGTGMSGAAIAQLQSQAAQPIEELKDSFWLVKEKQGKIRASMSKWK